MEAHSPELQGFNFYLQIKNLVSYQIDPEPLLINREENPTGKEIRLAAKGESFLPCLEAKNSV